MQFGEWRRTALVPVWGGDGRIHSRTKVKGLTRPAPWFFLFEPSGSDAARPKARVRGHCAPQPAIVS
jgi:hypothetical protein